MENKMGSLFQKNIELRNDRSRFQDHNPKNLAQTISVKAPELQEIFRWLSTDTDEKLGILSKI